MQKVVDAGLADDPQLFASNTLVIAVPKGNPGGVESLDDLADPGLTVVLCAPEVPCGAASETLLPNEGAAVTPASLEQNVTAVLTKVAAGEADAGLVYATDVRPRRRRGDRARPAPSDVVNHYPIAALTEAANPDAAAAFVDVRALRRGRPCSPGSASARRDARARPGRLRAAQLARAGGWSASRCSSLPLVALVCASTGRRCWADVTAPEALSALRLSLATGLVATRLCVVLGVPLALVIARSGPATAAVLRALVTVPLVLPPMVGGVALLFLFGRTGWLGGMLAEWGIRVPFTTHRRRAGADVRGAAVPRARARGVAAHHGRRLRAGRRGARRRTLDDPRARDAAARGARAHRGRRSCASPGRSASSARRRCSRATRPA